MGPAGVRRVPAIGESDCIVPVQPLPIATGEDGKLPCRDCPLVWLGFHEREVVGPALRLARGIDRVMEGAEREDRLAYSGRCLVDHHDAFEKSGDAFFRWNPQSRGDRRLV